MRRADGQRLKSTMYLWLGHDSQSTECTQYSAAAGGVPNRQDNLRIRSTRREQRVQVTGERLNWGFASGESEVKQNKQNGIKNAITRRRRENKKRNG